MVYRPAGCAVSAVRFAGGLAAYHRDGRGLPAVDRLRGVGDSPVVRVGSGRAEPGGLVSPAAPRLAAPASAAAARSALSLSGIRGPGAAGDDLVVRVRGAALRLS